jgi:endogenous inhibitor of DNA gyrase (YacG/DUF329 family)
MSKGAIKNPQRVFKNERRIMVPISREDAITKGLDRYFTGEPCKYGDVAERDVTTGACLKCRALIYETKRNSSTKKERQSINCKQCGERFKQKRTHQIFCSSACRLESWESKPIAKNCGHCGGTFVGRRNAIFCSPRCRLAHWQPRLKGRDLFA